MLQVFHILLSDSDFSISVHMLSLMCAQRVKARCCTAQVETLWLTRARGSFSKQDSNSHSALELDPLSILLSFMKEE